MKCKTDVRQTVVARRDALPPLEVAGRSAQAADRLFSLPDLADARLVMFFVTFRSEVDTLPMITRALEQRKRVAAPRAEPESRSLLPCEISDPERDLAPGAYGIREPRPHCPTVDPAAIDIVLVPAAAWSEDGYRVGYGGGYYDRFLRRIPQARRIGLGFEMQVVPDVPHDAHDLPVDVLVTEARVRRFPHRNPTDSNRQREGGSCHGR